MPGTDPASPSVLAAVLHYGVSADGSSLRLLDETLTSLLGMAHPNVSFVIVDNGSTDGSRKMVKENYPMFEFIENGKNLGVGEGYNVALRLGMERNADWVFLLNNDISVAPDMLVNLLQIGKSNPRIGILGPKTYFHARPNILWYAGGNVNFFTGIISHRGIYEEDRGQFDTTGETDYVNGCAMLVRRTVIAKVGLFDSVFHPAYSEDADYCLRAKRAGFSLMYVPTAKLWHKVSASSGGGMSPTKTRLKVEHNFLVLKRHAKWYHWLTIPWCIGGMTFLFVLRELLKGNVKVVAALFRGFTGVLKKAVS